MELSTTMKRAGKILSERLKKKRFKLESRSQLFQINEPLKKKKIVTPAPPKDSQPKKVGSGIPMSAC